VANEYLDALSGEFKRRVEKANGQGCKEMMDMAVVGDLQWWFSL
jgi:hypothetical protein